MSVPKICVKLKQELADLASAEQSLKVQQGSVRFTCVACA